MHSSSESRHDSTRPIPRAAAPHEPDHTAATVRAAWAVTRNRLDREAFDRDPQVRINRATQVAQTALAAITRVEADLTRTQEMLINTTQNLELLRIAASRTEKRVDYLTGKLVVAGVIDAKMMGDLLSEWPGDEEIWAEDLREQMAILEGQEDVAHQSIAWFRANE